MGHRKMRRFRQELGREECKCGNRVKMLRLNIDHISGKEAIELVNNKQQ